MQVERVVRKNGLKVIGRKRRGLMKACILSKEARGEGKKSVG